MELAIAGNIDEKRTKNDRFKSVHWRESHSRAQGREVDFAILKEGCVIELIEAKYSEQEISKSLIYYAEKLKPALAVQVVGKLKKRMFKGNIKNITAIDAFPPGSLIAK
ncbi:MAG: hypothetical protein HYU97_05800 [Deltaproteobacteria bacterium]|nr:hypothetical protein [Deltaproteobacteria bacterium]